MRSAHMEDTSPACGGELRKGAPVGLVLQRLPPKEFFQLKVESGDEYDEPTSMGAVRAATMQGAAAMIPTRTCR